MYNDVIAHVGMSSVKPHRTSENARDGEGCAKPLRMGTATLQRQTVTGAHRGTGRKSQLAS